MRILSGFGGYFCLGGVKERILFKLHLVLVSRILRLRGVFRNEGSRESLWSSFNSAL